MAAEQDDLIFQRAVPADSAEILLLLRRISTYLAEKGIDQWRWFFGKKGEETLARRFREGEVTKILRDRTILGVFVVQEDDAFWHSLRKDGSALWIHTMGIDPSLMGKGIGKQILSRVEGIAVRAGKKYARLDCNGNNERLCRYYESNGFKNAGSKPWENWTVRLYEKEL